jgi:hypothetical protein
MTLVWAGSILSVAPRAHAQAEDRAAARALFDEGRKLASEGQYAAACPKFEAAAKVYTSAGILLNLADCYEKTGRTASAWTEFGEAASVATRTSRPSDAAEATRRQGALQSALTYLVVRVAREVPGLVVKADGAVLARAAWGTSIPVDPGSHEIRADAPGYDPWRGSIDASKPGQTASVEVPELRSSPSATPAAGESAPQEGAGQEGTSPLLPARSRAPAWALTVGGGVVGLAGATAMIVESLRAADARTRHDVSFDYDSAQAVWTTGLVGSIAGGGCLAAGVILFATSGKGSAPAQTGLRAMPWWGTNGGGLRVAGSW